VKRETWIAEGTSSKTFHVSPFTFHGSLNGIFEHPAGCTPIFPDVQTGETPVCPEDFSAAY
jgi:hypothetical protein